MTPPGAISYEQGKHAFTYSAGRLRLLRLQCFREGVGQDGVGQDGEGSFLVGLYASVKKKQRREGSLFCVNLLLTTAVVS